MAKDRLLPALLLQVPLLLWCMALAGPALCAEGGVAIHRGDHPGYSRIVFVLPTGSDYAFDVQGSTVKLRFPGVGEVPGGPPGSRVVSIAGGHDSATVVAIPGKTCRVWRNGGRVVVDVLDAPDAPHTAVKPAAPKPARAARAADTPKSVQHAVHPAPPPNALVLTGIEDARAKTRPSAPAVAGNKAEPAGAEKAKAPAELGPQERPAVRLAPAALPPPVLPAPVLPTPVVASPLPPPAAAKPEPAATPATPPALPEPEPMRADLPAPAEPSFAASLLAAEDGWPNGAMLLPFAGDVGAVAYRRGGEGFVVFDTAQPTDLGMLRNDPVYGGAAVSLLPAGTILHLKLAADTELRLARGPDGWRIGIVPVQTGGHAIVANTSGGALTLAAQSPGRIVVIDDPATGGRLLAGTQRTAGQGWPVAYASAEFSLSPTWQGIVVQPVSDRAVLKVVKDGFALTADPLPPLAIPPIQQAGQEVASSAGMTRRFDFPALPEPLLRNRLNQARQDSAAAPKLGRFAPRLRAAQAMIALGMDVEAAAVLRAAQSDDPAAMEDADAAGLSAMAHWLAGRASQADRDLIDSPKLSGSDEVALWRALLHGDDTDASAPAAALASSWKLVLTYPAPLRRRLLGPMADLLQRGHQTAALRAMLAALPDHELDSARAALLVADGETGPALDALARLAAGPDRLASSRARRATTELLLASHRIDARTAAAQLEQQLYAWRGGPQDFDLRMRLAALDAQAGNWRAGLAVLRETEPLYPEKHDILYATERSQVAELIHGLNSGHMAPLDLVAVAEECADLLAQSGGDAKLAPVLADKLIALDLPDRAEPVLQHILDGTSDPQAKAQVGLKLAQLRLDLRGTKAALDTLDASEAPDLPSPLAADRALARARAQAAGGETEAALKLLADLDTPPALDLRDRLEERKHDWPAAEATVAALVQQTLPASGALDIGQQTLLVHLAGLASQAGDMAELHRLQAGQGSRIAPGPRADLFRLLTESPVGAVADLPRSEKELNAARTVPAALASLRER
jgi:hypothetical protein